MMTFGQHMTDVPATEAREHRPFVPLWWRVVDWMRACARYYAAAQTYEQLSGLSDAELHRRGLDRETLGREVFEVFDRGDKL